ncbi:MAG: host attachment protein [Gammaproteobacteria bacterium]|nr:host attachment protein [Gammaproteobacteria bacterium]MDE2345809.1 host attachment protein [Gammaproteobacteria bacterium]
MAGDMLVVAADRGRARLFSIAPGQERLQEIQDFLNADARLRARNLASDRQGRGLNRTRASRAALGNASLQDESASRFAHEVSGVIAGKLLRKTNTRLFVIADPQFLGLLRGELRARKLRAPVRYIAKNLTRSSSARIRGYLPKRLWPRRVLGIQV